MLRYIFVCIFGLATVQCSFPKEKIPTQNMVLETKKIVIYQMMTRLFGNTKTKNVLYGTIEENGVGKFEDISDKALTELKNLGITHIWYTGIIEHATLTDYTKYGVELDDADVVKGRAGSPYAIKDYYDVDPDLAIEPAKRMQEFELLVERTHKNNLKVIIDFVPNHLARRYHSDSKPDSVMDFGASDDTSKPFDPNNNFYYIENQSFIPPRHYPNFLYSSFKFDRKFVETPAKATGNDIFTSGVPTKDDWFETVKLNYGVDYLNDKKKYFDPVPSTWLKMRDILRFWAEKKVDGFRCDMAEMVPIEFWHWVIPQVKEINTNICFIAEIYNPSQYVNYLNEGNFDFLYDKVQLYDTLRLLINSTSDTREIAKIQNSLNGINSNMVHFLENHDEQRIASPFFADNPWKALPGMVVSTLIDQGPVMIYFGQEVGETGAETSGFSGNDGRTTIFDYWGVPAHQKWVNEKRFDGGQLSEDQKKLRQFYSNLFSIANSKLAISLGSYHDLTEYNVSENNISNKICVFARVFEHEKIVIVTSFNPQAEKIKIQLTSEVAENMKLTKGKIYNGTDLLDEKTEFVLTSDLSFQLEIAPFQSYIINFE